VGRAAFVILCCAPESVEVDARYQRQLHHAAGHDAARSDLAAVIGAHCSSACRCRGRQVRSPGLAVPLDLPDVSAHRLPSPDLPPVLVGQAAAHVVAAVPLEPTARVVGVNPTLLAPHRQRLAGVDAEEVERAVAAARGQLGAGEPALWETPCGYRSCTCRRKRRAAASAAA
jgi:hypothetical protein